MIMRMQKRFIAAIAAIAIAVTGISAAPARAGDDDAAAAIAALLGLAVIGAVIADKRKDKKQREHVAPPVSRPDPHKPVRPLPQRVSRKLLPQQCLRSFQTDRGHARLFVQRCLHRNYGFTHTLPTRCHREIYTDRGWRQGYGAKCLNRHGYQLARH